MSSADDLAGVSVFRNRLVAYMNRVQSAGTGLYSGPRDPADEAIIRADQPWLAQEYGRLYRVINRWGGMMMASPAFGISSSDVIQDAIHDINDASYNDIARLSVQHLDTVIGRLRAQAEEDASATFRPDDLYRLTSVAFWLGRLLALLRWLVLTKGGRIIAIVGVVLLAVISGIVSGVAQGWYQQVFASH